MNQKLVIAKAKVICDYLGPGPELGMNQKLVLAKAKAICDFLGPGHIGPGPLRMPSGASSSSAGRWGTFSKLLLDSLNVACGTLGKALGRRWVSVLGTKEGPKEVAFQSSSMTSKTPTWLHMLAKNNANAAFQT